MEDDEEKELQLLPSQQSSASSSSYSRMPFRPPDFKPLMRQHRSSTPTDHQFGGPSLDLQLSISLTPIKAPSNYLLTGSICDGRKVETGGCVEALKWQAAEQIRLASIEKAYAERVRELTRREMELAQSEFARARNMWQRAREEAEKAERMKERAITRQIDSTCMEITCQSCRQRFRPA